MGCAIEPLPNTTHGTAIYAAPDRPPWHHPNIPQLIGSPMAVPDRSCLGLVTTVTNPFVRGKLGDPLVPPAKEPKHRNPNSSNCRWDGRQGWGGLFVGLRWVFWVVTHPASKWVGCSRYFEVDWMESGSDVPGVRDRSIGKPSHKR